MTLSSNNSLSSDRLKRIEQGLWLDLSAWSQTGQRRPLTERMAFYTTPGVSVAIINEGVIELASGYGVTEAGQNTPITPDTIFQACSISKHVAMLGALLLVQEGVLDLDEDINHYLLTWKLPPNQGWQPRITIRQLLGHTAGLTYNWYRGFRHGAAIPTLLQVLEGQAPANTPPVRATLLPGSQFRYSGSHYSVLQQLLSDVTKTPFPQLMHELIFAPLGMENSSYEQNYPDRRPETTAVGHYIGGEPVYGKWRVIPEMAGAGLWTTATDLAQVACEIQRAHLGQPTRALSKAVVDQALQPQVAPFFGLGIQLDGTGDTQRFGHGGDNIGYKCTSTTYLKHGKGAVVLTNADDGSGLINELLHTISQEYAWPNYDTTARQPTNAASPMRNDFAGVYEVRPNFQLTVQIQADRLWLIAPGQTPFELYPSSATTFFAQALSSEITFEQAEDGAVNGLLIRQGHETIPAPKKA